MNEIILIPGLGDNVKYVKFLTKNWERRYNVKLHIIPFGFNGGFNEFEDRFKVFLNKVDEIIENGNKVSLIGSSAGASVVINAYCLRKDRINKVISVCGRLKDVNVKQRFYYPKNPLTVFKESIALCEKNLLSLTQDDKKKILYFKPLFDDVVPVRTMIINGANYKRLFSFQHGINISFALTLMSEKIISFINI